MLKGSVFLRALRHAIDLVVLVVEVVSAPFEAKRIAPSDHLRARFGERWRELRRSPSEDRIEADLDGLRVILTLGGHTPAAWVVEVPGLELPADFQLSFQEPSGPDATIEDAWFVVRGKGDQIRLGEVAGSRDWVLARLDGATRRQIASIAERAQLSIRPARLRAELDQRDALDLGEIVARAVALASALSRERSDPAAAIAEIARNDNVDAWDLRCMRHLATAHASHPATLAAARALAAERTPALRVSAGMALGEEGVPVLQAVADDSGCDAAARLAALRALLKIKPEQGSSALVRLLLDPHGPLAAAIQVAAEHQSRAAVPPLLAHVRECPEATAISAAGALAAIGDRQAAAPLLEALERPELTVRLAVIAALGAVGTIETVEPLALIASGEGRASPSERHAARLAVSQIQARLGHPEGGNLSLSGADRPDGSLSLTDAAGGELSVTDLPRN